MSELARKQAPEDFNPMSAQSILQQRMVRRFPDRKEFSPDQAATMEQLTLVINANLAALSNEAEELRSEMPWKFWKDYKVNGLWHDATLKEHELASGGGITRAKYELVDMLHFVFNIAIALGMNWQEVLDLFYTKQEENHARQDRGY